ncbi:hypothetical protein NONO_c09280 [Nocardia nova SH22a]|uniref:Uncharacterized protein n=1 Tax=Nocardia nova SH22a TaxID=1415166 RepID=W5T8S9_9NOCA|nr:hypothetical protein [Nocardia nova]AHH15735.1 hypothetical protein NONO_c09280 [Nocardia nova SH22a]
MTTSDDRNAPPAEDDLGATPASDAPGPGIAPRVHGREAAATHEDRNPARRADDDPGIAPESGAAESGTAPVQEHAREEVATREDRNSARRAEDARGVAAAHGAPGDIAPPVHVQSREEAAPDHRSPAPPEGGTGTASDEPDVGFTLGGGIPVPDTSVVDPEARIRELSHDIARELAASAPEGWRELTAVFAVTVVVGGGEVVFTDDEERMLRAEPPESVLDSVREHRDLSASFEGGPWWRLLVQLDREGHLNVDYDFGDDPFPDDQLLTPEAYLADLQAYPRERIPVWLAAYIGHDDRQSRPPAEAARQIRADRAAGVVPVVSDNDFPDLATLWSRWSVMAAAFVAAGSQWGPRVLPSLGWFEGSRRGGCTLYLLPGGRAVLSGGVWDAPALDAAYNRGEPMPRLYAGAPEWVSNSVLNPRFGNGLLSFCYWWEDGRWYRGESPAADELSDALPGVWTSATVAQVICGLIDGETGDDLRAAVDTLVAAAEANVVTRETLVSVFGDDGSFDIDGAFNQISMAGATFTGPAPLPETAALDRVRRHITEQETDTDRYPLERLCADRISVGWMVYVPTDPDEVAIGRAIFYVADDGVLEQSSSSIAPSIYADGFEQRFRERRGALRAG